MNIMKIRQARQDMTTQTVTSVWLENWSTALTLISNEKCRPNMPENTCKLYEATTMQCLSTSFSMR